MMEAWVLLIYIAGAKGFFWNGEPTVASHEFNSEATCLAAKQAYFEQLKRSIDPFYIRMSCVKK